MKVWGVLAATLLFGVTGLSAQATDAPAPPPAPYSLPWLLRPIAPASVVRLDETLAFLEDASSGANGATYVTSVTASHRLSPRWAPVLRWTFVHNDPPGSAGATGSGVSNPLVGINHSRPFGKGWRWTGFVATTLPVGSGGGDAPEKAKADAMSAAIPARSAMDNALFAVNYWTLIGGVSVARVTKGLSLQGELTVLQLSRVRGPDTQDESRTNLTAGLHAGHFFSPRVSVGGEVRMQRWLSDAAPVRSDPRAREQFTFGIGPRFHFQLAGRRWLRPGVSYTRALDEPMKGKGYDILQIDFPLAF